MNNPRKYVPAGAPACGTVRAPRRKIRAEVRKAIAASKMKFDLSWDELRQRTREP
jgi:hypothetical protein